MSGKMASTTSTSISSMSRPHNLMPSTTKASPPSKKAPKETKSDKSLETTVEKLTQNRNKEISAKCDVASVKNVDKVESKDTRLKEGERNAEKALERVSESEKRENLGEKGSNSKLSADNVSNSDSPSPAVVNAASGVEGASPPAVECSPDKSRLEVGLEGAKSDEVSAKESGGGTDSSGSVKKSPCIDRDKEETSGSSTVTTNGSNSSKSSEEVVEGGDK